MFTRRQLLSSVSALAAGGVALPLRAAMAQEDHSGHQSTQRGTHHPSTITLDGSSLPWKMESGVKVFHLIAEPVVREFAPGMKVRCWGYNGSTPGPTIEAVEGDRVRILVTNKLPEHTTVHWHGVFLPNGMDGGMWKHCVITGSRGRNWQWHWVARCPASMAQVIDQRTPTNQ